MQIYIPTLNIIFIYIYIYIYIYIIYIYICYIYMLYIYIYINLLDIYKLFKVEEPLILLYLFI